MYGIERSAVVLTIEVGTAEVMTMLEDRGKVGGSRVGVVLLAPGPVGSNHAVYHLVSLHILPNTNEYHVRTMFVSIWNFVRSTVFVILLTKSAVPMPSPLPILKPQPRFGLFRSPIVPAAALTTVLKSARSLTAGVAMAIGARMMPVKSMAGNMECSLMWTENMLR
jgi:hypothetical protein